MTLTCDCGQQFTKVSKYMSHVRTYHPVQVTGTQLKGYSKTQIQTDLTDPRCDASKRGRFVPDRHLGLIITNDDVSFSHAI